MSHLQGVFMSQSIGERIKLIRGSLGVGEFAEILGINRKTVTRWEADESLPDGISLLALMKHFQADPAWVLTGSGVEPVLNSRESALLDNYRNSDEKGKKAVEIAASAFAYADTVKKAANGG